MNKRVHSYHFFIFQRHHVEEIRPKSKKFFEKLKMKITLTEISKIHLKKLHTLLCQGQSWGKESVHIHGKHMKAQKRREKSKNKFLEICHIFLHYLYCKIDQISTKLQKFSSPLWWGLWSCSYLMKSLNESFNADYHFFSSNIFDLHQRGTNKVIS